MTPALNAATSSWNDDHLVGNVASSNREAFLRQWWRWQPTSVRAKLLVSCEVMALIGAEKAGSAWRVIGGTGGVGPGSGSG
jgi:hypothetical protein